MQPLFLDFLLWCFHCHYVYCTVRHSGRHHEKMEAGADDSSCKRDDARCFSKNINFRKRLLFHQQQQERRSCFFLFLLMKASLTDQQSSQSSRGRRSAIDFRRAFFFFSLSFLHFNLKFLLHTPTISVGLFINYTFISL